MVMSITSLTGNGLKDWLIQRVSAVYLLIYLLCVLGCFGLHAPFTYEQWFDVFQSPVVQVTTILACVMILLHAWIGIWTVTTDYIHCTLIRLSLQVLVAIFLSAQLIWGVMMVSGKVFSLI
ncbi:MAG: succinate dehydrogenase, hydrophobic membrane anchor protein [Legionella sp.]|nr:MAG: succinate dehydrogenase, hydrophobic membrane anchor protein [Legionella sp.]